MSSDFFMKVPLAPVQPDRPVVEIPPPSESQPAAPENPDQIRAVDSAFAQYQEKGGFMEALGFYAGMMWLGDIVKDIARPLPPLDDEEPKRKEEPEAEQ